MPALISHHRGEHGMIPLTVPEISRLLADALRCPHPPRPRRPLA